MLWKRLTTSSLPSWKTDSSRSAPNVKKPGTAISGTGLFCFLFGLEDRIGFDDDLDVLDIAVLRSFDGKADIHMIHDVIDVVLGNDFARKQDRNSRRIDINELGDDPAGGFLERNHFRVPVESIPWNEGELGNFRNFDDQFIGRVDVVIRFRQLAESFKQDRNRLLVVARRDQAKDVVHIAQLDFDVEMIAQPVFRFVTGNAQMADMDGQLGRIVVERGFPSEDFVSEAVQAVDFVDAAAGFLRELNRSLRHVVAVDRQIAPGRVQRCQQQVRGRGGRQHADDRLHALRVDVTVFRVQIQHRALRHGAPKLVHACGGHICAGFHRRHRQILMEMDEHAVSFVHEDGHMAAMGQVDDFLQVGANAKVRRIDDEHRFRIRMAVQGALYGFGRDAVVDAQILVAGRGDEYRFGARKNDGRHDRFVNVAGDDDFFSRRAYGQDHRHDGAACPLHAKISIICAEGVGGKLLRFFDNAGRLVQVIQRRNVDQIYG